jgi:hypothetical protein
MNAVPRPPAGLKDRIVADIPTYLQPEAERNRFSRAIAFNMRVAASILLMVTGLLTTLYLITPDAEEPLGVRSVALKNVARDLGQPAPTAAMTSAAPAEEVNLEITEEADVARIAAAARPIVQADASSGQRQRADAQPAGNEVTEAIVGSVEGGFIDTASSTSPAMAEGRFAPEPQMRDERREQTILAEALPPPEPVAAPRVADAPRRLAAAAPAPAAVPPPPAASASLVTEAYAAKIELERKDSVFGFSVDPEVFHRIRTTLENGNRPTPSMVDVDALVNYFAGQPASRPRRGVRLEVEASPAAIEADGDHAILRFTIDTQEANVPAGGSTPPVAADARVEVLINENVVASAHPIGDVATDRRESALLAGTSVTGLYALELKPNLRSGQLVATVLLHYKSVTDGKSRTITRRIHGHDLAKSWARSTARHRRASLGAVWGETLKGTAGGSAVARRAEELATQNPKDARARELAKAASASAPGGR